MGRGGFLAVRQGLSQLNFTESWGPDNEHETMRKEALQGSKQNMKEVSQEEVEENRHGEKENRTEGSRGEKTGV